MQWPDNEHKNIIGSVVDILGKTGENNAEMHAILAQYNLPYKYPKNVEDAADKIDAAITPQEIDRREDFREVRRISTMHSVSVSLIVACGRLVSISLT